jgi:two-component system cell cycle response regulator
VKGLEAGADDFLTKPIDDVALMARVRSLTRLKAAIDDLRIREASGRRLGLIEDRDRSLDPSGARILVVDDNARQAAHIAATLRTEHRVHVWSADEDLAAAVGDRIDLLILSLASETFDGMRVLSALRAAAAFRQLPILLVVNPDERRRAVQALDLGGSDIINRPIEPQELRARVRTQVRRKRYLDAVKAALDHGLELAVLDPLTGLHNRRYLLSQLRPLMVRAARGGEELSLLLIDVDHFKLINDSFGHDVGDEALREIAQRIGASFRPLDITCRFGGEEFLVVMPNTRRGDAYAIAERLRRQIALTPVRVRDGLDALNLTLSIGVASTLGGDDSAEALIRRADEAVYKAKAEGRNRVIAEQALAA